MGGMFLRVMLVHVLTAYTDVPLWGCDGIVGSGFGILGWRLRAVGTHTIKAITVMPQTVETMQENGPWLSAQRTSCTISRLPVWP